VSYGLNARDYGAVGDENTDDTDALQRAIDDSQLQGRELFLPAGGYLIHRQLNFSCRNPEELCTTTSMPCTTCTRMPVKLRGEGHVRTKLIAASKMSAVLDFGGRKSADGRSYHYSDSHQVSDLHIDCYNETTSTPSGKGMADYGIFAPGTTHVVLSRIRVDGARLAGLYTFFAFLTQVENSLFYGNRIGIHSGSTNLRTMSLMYFSCERVMVRSARLRVISIPMNRLTSPIELVDLKRWL